MSAVELQACLVQHRAHSAMTFAMDEELGTHHGLAWADFVLLSEIEDAGGSLSIAELARCMGVTRSRFVLQLLPLEKIGLVCRATEGGERRVRFGAQGRRLLRESRETAAAVCRGLRAGA